MKYITAQNTQNMFDGPFKVPLPKKTSAFSSRQGSGRSNIQAPKPKYRGVDSKYSSFVYQKLLGKLLENPENMTKYDMKVLSTHPVIKRLLKTSKEGSTSNTNFYVPIDSLLNPELYTNSHVPVIIESNSEEQKSDVAKQNGDTENMDDDTCDDTTHSNSDSDDLQESKVGFYTKKERQQKILRYRAKLQKFRESKASRQVRPKRKYNRVLSKNQPRKNGRFASYPDVTDSILEMIHHGSEDGLPTCSGQNVSPYANKAERDLNDIVSEITGIF